MRIAYLVSIYPRVTHSFIRREILAVEAAGLQVERFAVREPTEQLQDACDLAEAEKTRYLLTECGLRGMFFEVLRCALKSPISFLRAALLSVKTGLRADVGLAKMLVYLAEACVVKRWCEERKVDHIHAHFGTNATDVAMFCRVLGGPSYSFAVHGPEEWDRVEGISLPEKVEHAAFVAAISAFARSQVMRWCRFEDYDKIHIVRMGVDASFLSEEPLPPVQSKRLVCIGRLCTHKAQMLIIEATRDLVKEGHDLEVVLVGGGEIQAQLEERIRELRLEKSVRITGWVGGHVVYEELKNARAMVLPSLAEGLPVVIMEALSLGRPVVTTNIAGIPELVVDGECGWVLTPGVVEEIRDAMRDALCASSEQMNSMGRFGFKRVADMHDSSKEGVKLAALFRMYVTASVHDAAVLVPQSAAD